LPYHRLNSGLLKNKHILIEAELSRLLWQQAFFVSKISNTPSWK